MYVLTANQPRPTAIVCANDRSAIGVMLAAAQLGLSVPGDLSVVGYDDSPIASTHLLRLTTVDSRNAEIGAVAAERLVARIGGGPDTGAAVLLEPELVVRGSTAAPRATG